MLELTRIMSVIERRMFAMLEEMKAQNHAMSLRMFTILEELKSQNQTTNLLMQQLVARSLTGQELDSGPLPEGLLLPLNSMSEIDHLDVLVQDTDVKAKVVCRSCMCCSICVRLSYILRFCKQ